jgi:hypothetical protein
MSEASMSPSERAEAFDERTDLASVLAPYQMRVVDELDAVAPKLMALSAFVSAPAGVFAGLPDVEKLLLRAQLGAMMAYADILRLRIGLWLSPA